MSQLNKIFTKLVKWLLLALLLYGFNINTTQYILEADEPNQNPITVKSSTIISEFPKGIWLNLEASSSNKITEISSRLKIGQTRGTTYNYLCSKELNQSSQSWRCKDIIPNKNIDATLFWRTDTSGKYIPQGTSIEISFEIKDASGNVLITPTTNFVYMDPNFNWENISEGPVTLHYHGPVKSRAKKILDAIIQTLEKVGPILGADIDEPIMVTMYNNGKEMIDAQPPQSSTQGRELITEGQAFSNFGTLHLTGGNRTSIGTASHEVIHILVHRAGEGVFRKVPTWLNEGLAEWANIDPTMSYDIALEFAVATDRVPIITKGNTMPGKPEDAIIFYGASRSIVTYLISEYGYQKMHSLFSELKSDIKLEDAIQKVYGFDIQKLENMWRKKIGATEYTENKLLIIKPTAEPIKTIEPFTLNNSSQNSKSRSATSSTNATTQQSLSCNLFPLRQTKNIDLSILGLLIFLILFKSKPD
jgi:hypothetical protein